MMQVLKPHPLLISIYSLDSALISVTTTDTTQHQVGGKDDLCIVSSSEGEFGSEHKASLKLMRVRQKFLTVINPKLLKLKMNQYHWREIMNLRSVKQERKEGWKN